MDRAKQFYEASLNVSLEIHDVGEALMAWFPKEDHGAGSSEALMLHEKYQPRWEAR